MKLIFIAGPFSADTKEKVEQNILTTEQLGFKVAELGMAPIVPNSMGRSWRGIPSYETWINTTKFILSQCSVVLIAPNWENSNGTKKEIEYAEQLNIPVFYSIAELENYIKINFGSVSLAGKTSKL